MTKSKKIECLIREMIGTAAMHGNNMVIEDCVRLMGMLSQIEVDDVESIRKIEEKIRRTCKHLK